MQTSSINIQNRTDRATLMQGATLWATWLGTVGSSDCDPNRLAWLEWNEQFGAFDEARAMAVEIGRAMHEWNKS